MIFINILAFYLPLEEFILKWLPITDQTYLLLRQIPDIIVVLLFLLLVVKKNKNRSGIPIIGKRIDALLLAFFVWSFIASLLNSVDLLSATIKIKAQLRYVLLIYSILILNPSQGQVKKTLRLIGWAVLVQVIIGIFQFSGGIPARDFLAARHTKEIIAGMKVAFTGDRFVDVNDLMGTMGNTIGYGMFLLVGLSLWIVSCRTGGKWYWLGTSVLTILLYLSGSRSVVIAAVIVVSAHHWMVLGSSKLSRKILLLTPLFITLVIFALLDSIDILPAAARNEDFSYMFTANYIQVALKQRLGILVYIVPQLLITPHSVIGFGPDKLLFVDYVNTNFHKVPHMLLAVLPDVIEDVYWVAQVAYYGFIGLFLWILFLLRSGKMIVFARKHALSYTSTRVTTIALLLLLISVPLNFFNQAFSVRGYSFYLWLMCGLALSLYRREKFTTTGENLVENTSLS